MSATDTITSLGPRLASGELRSERLTEDALAVIAELNPDNVRIRLEMGRYVLAEDYLRAVRGRAVIRREIDRALEGVDALILPGLPIEAPPIGAASVAVKGGNETVRTLMLRCTQPFNLSGHPVISVPCGTTKAGLPIGLQIVGHLGRTPDLLRVARSLEPMLNSR